jgi:AcrR family transcriptional regulator
MSLVEPTRPQRADARRNRSRLTAAALELFAESQTVSLEAVAGRAGVGIGTLYRHFPTREALIEAAYRDEVGRLCAVDELLAAHPPDLALVEWMERFVAYAATKRGMSEALQAVIASRNAQLFAETRAQIVDAIGALLTAAAAAGTLRRDVDPDDVFRAMGAVWQLPLEPGWQERARRLLGLLMDGLRYGAGSA